MRRTTHRITRLLVIALVVAGMSAATVAAEGKVNINDATVEQLSLLPRVGPSVAQRIIDFRKEIGGFKSVEDLMLVRGIGEKTFERLAPYVSLSGETTLTEKVRAGAAASEEDDERR
jgi:competence protein ComEA